MKKLIVLFFFLISCTDQSLVEDSNIILEIEPDTNEGESSESQNYSNANVLEYPVDFDIETLFECLGDNGINPIPSPEFNNNNILKSIFKSKEVKYIKISNTKKAHITHVVTKLVVSTTLGNRDLVLSVEHWKSLKGFNDHINIDSIAPANPREVTKL